MSIPDQIRAAASGGTAESRPYGQGNTTPVTVFRKNKALYWTSGMSIDCDGQPGSACNLSTDPYFQPNTAWNQSDGKPLKAEVLPYVVIPLASELWNYANSGVRGGDLCVMAYRDKYVFGVVGDLGPKQRIGEASYAAAQAVGVNPNPRTGGVGSGVTYVVFPGVRVSPIESKAKAVELGAVKLAEWLGNPPPPSEGDDSVSAVDKMIAEAVKTLGMSDNNNTTRTPIHTWYNAKFGNPDPGKYAWDWCNGAVTYWAHMSGNADAVVFGPNGHYAYTVAHAQAFQSRGRWTAGTSGIKAGDIVFFDWDGSRNISAIDHVGIVERVDGANIHTIEGNIENACKRKVRTASNIAGYGRPSYASTGGGSVPTPIGGTVKLSEARAKVAAPTRVIQNALNQEFGGVVVDGQYGPQTEAAYKRWQQSLGWPGDGLPGEDSLSKLGAKYGFAVTLDWSASPAPQPPAPATYTVKAGDTLSAVARALNVSGGWEALYAANKAVIGADPGRISVGMKLTVPSGGSTPAPAPQPEVPAVTSVTFEDLGPGGVKAQNLIVQVLLAKHWKLNYSSGPGIWGPQTMDAYSRFQKSLGFKGSPAQPGSDADGRPGVTSMTRFCALYGLTLKRRAGGSTPAPAPSGEPVHSYARTTHGGRTVNKRTDDMLHTAETISGVKFTLSQGSYNRGGVAASAGTHDGGGVVDISVSNWSATTRKNVVQALRKAGFAAWLRTPAQGFSYHIHACAIGDREMAQGAKNQVTAYFNGRDGLARNGADTDAPRPYPSWAAKYR